MKDKSRVMSGSPFGGSSSSTACSQDAEVGQQTKLFGKRPRDLASTEWHERRFSFTLLL